MKRVLIIDDHAVVRNGLKKILEEQPGQFTFGEAETISKAIALVHEQSWDIAILDISLRDGRNGLDALREMKQIKPQLPVLILTMHAEEQYARLAFKAGAAGYVTKDSSPAELVGAINKILRGSKYVSPGMAERLISYIQKDAGLAPHELLSDREFQVFRLIALGKAVGEIAEVLSLSDRTISTYRARILEKMGMQSNADLTRYAIRNQLVE